MRTRDKLADELRKVAAIASPENAAKYEAFAVRALTGEFDDFADTYDCPITQLHSELTAAGFTKFAARVADGEFDATKEESDAWANSPEGRETLGLLARDIEKSPHKGGLGDAPVEPVFDEQMKAIAGAIDLMFNGPIEKASDRTVGFVLMVTPFDNNPLPARMSYVSNISRPQVVKMLKEQLRYFEAQDMGHETNPDRPQGHA